MSNALAIVNEKPPAPKKERDGFFLIETQPEADWFVKTKTPRGRTVWYLRFRMTGWNPRLYGPFRSRHDCLLFLDEAINHIQDTEPDLVDDACKRKVKEPCAHSWLPIVEHPLVKKGR